MPSKRTPIDRPLVARITPEAVALFRQIEEILAAGLDETWEAEGGRRRECLDAEVRLHGLLGIQPWDEEPNHCSSNGPPPEWCKGERAERYKKAQAWRRALEEASNAH